MADDSIDNDLDLVFTRHARSNDEVPKLYKRPHKEVSMIGRCTKKTARKRPRLELSTETVDADGDDLDDAPAYVKNRRQKFERKREKLDLKGLMLPPDYDDVYLSGDDRLATLAERPAFTDLVPSAPYEDITMKSSAGVIPAPIAQWLRPYQVDGAKFMHEAFVYQRGAILGDDMGLGKTIQVIAFLTAAFGKTGDERDAKRMRTMRRNHRDRHYPRVLLIAPGSLLKNWENELERWGWWWTYQYTGTTKNEALQAASTGRLEVMLTTYSTYRTNQEAINRIQWDCVVADECHQFKERKSQVTKAMNAVNALCRIGLTGTAIQNNYEELWVLLNWANPAQIMSLQEWKLEVSQPLRMGQSHSASVAQLAKARRTAQFLAHQLLPRFLLRRMKSLIAHQLPKKSDKIVFCPMTEAQLDAYNNFCDSEIMQNIRAGTADAADVRANLFPALILLQKLSNHLALLVPSSEAERDKHERELEFLQMAVPEDWETMYAQRDSIRNYANQDFCGKWRVLKKMLKLWYENGDKVLIFSHSVRLLKMLHSLFQSKTSYTVSYLDGGLGYEERQRTVDEYNSSPERFVFLISTKAGGVGLNITSANKVVVVDPAWNPAWDLQAQDRAYRIGQTRDVDVFRLVSVDTVEEIVYARQIYKQQQANIGYNASVERRYFKGVQKSDQQGELFGIANLFAVPGERIALRDIVNQTNVAETRAGVEIAGLDMEALAESDDDDSNDGDGDEDIDGEASQERAMSQLAASIIDSAGQRKHKAQQSASKKDPIQAILDSAGVKYTHENAEVIGTSKIEMQISSRAQKAGANIRWSKEAAFGKDGELEGRQQYEFKPPEDVCQRQFCTMARWCGFENVSEFAMVVESWTQERRRKFLDEFYTERRILLAKTAEEVL